MAFFPDSSTASSAEELRDLSFKELKEKAEKLGCQVVSGAQKNDIIKMIISTRKKISEIQEMKV